MRSIGFSALMGLLLSGAGAVPDQPAPAPPAPLTISGPAGLYQVHAPAPVRLIQGANYVTITWDTAPAPVPAPAPAPAPAPMPVPTPAPAPAPAPAPVPTPAPAPAPAPDAAPVGPVSELDRAALEYARGLIAATAQGWSAAADELEKGSAVRDSLTRGAQVQYSERVQAMRRSVTPMLNKALAEGTEPASADQRALAVKSYRDLAASLRRALP